MMKKVSILIWIIISVNLHANKCKLFIQHESMSTPLNKAIDYIGSIVTGTSHHSEPLTQKEKDNFIASGYKLSPVNITYDSLGLAFIDNNQTFALSKNAGKFKYYGQVKVMSGAIETTKKIVIAESEKIINCLDLITRNQKIQKTRSLIEKALEHYRQNRIGMAVLAIEQIEFLHHGAKANKLKSLELNYSFLLGQVQKAIAELKSNEEKLLALRSVLLKNGLTKYRRDLTTITDFLQGKGGNCVTRTILFAAIIKELGLGPSKDSMFGIEIYSDHVQTVLYNKGKGLVHDLVYLEEHKLKTNIYDLDYYLNHMFRKRAWFLFEDEKKVFLDSQKQLLWGEPSPAELNFDDIISPSNERVDIFNFNHFSYQTKFSQGEAPEQLDEFHLLNRNDFNGTFKTNFGLGKGQSNKLTEGNVQGSNFQLKNNFVETLRGNDNYILEYHEDIDAIIAENGIEIFGVKQQIAESKELNSYTPTLLKNMSAKQISHFFPSPLASELYQHPLPIIYFENIGGRSSFRKGVWSHSSITIKGGKAPFSLFSIARMDQKTINLLKDAPSNEKWRTLFNIYNQRLEDSLNKSLFNDKTEAQGDLFDNIILKDRAVVIYRALENYTSFYREVKEYFGNQDSLESIYLHNKFPKEKLEFAIKELLKGYRQYITDLITNPHVHLMRLNQVSPEEVEQYLSKFSHLKKLFKSLDKKGLRDITSNITIPDEIIDPGILLLEYMLRSPDYEYIDDSIIQREKTQNSVVKPNNSPKINLPKIPAPLELCQQGDTLKRHGLFFVDCSKENRIFDENTLSKRRKVNLNEKLFAKLTVGMFYYFDRSLLSPWNVLMFHYLLTPKRLNHIQEEYERDHTRNAFYLGAGLKQSVWKVSQDELIASDCYKDYSSNMDCVIQLNHETFQKSRINNENYPNWVIDFPQYKTAYDKVMSRQNTHLKKFDQIKVEVSMTNEGFVYNNEKLDRIDRAQDVLEFGFGPIDIKQKDIKTVSSTSRGGSNTLYLRKGSYYTYAFIADAEKSEIYYLPPNINFDNILYKNEFRTYRDESELSLLMEKFGESLL